MMVWDEKKKAFPQKIGRDQRPIEIDGKRYGDAFGPRIHDGAPKQPTLPERQGLCGPLLVSKSFGNLKFFEFRRRRRGFSASALAAGKGNRKNWDESGLWRRHVALVKTDGELFAFPEDAAL